MLTSRVLRSVCWGASSVAIALVSGCANFTHVKTYADDTKKLSAAFAPMLAGTVSTCQENRERRALIAGTGRYNPQAVRDQATAVCKPLADANPGVTGLNTLLEQYADTLAALADEKLPDYKKELGSLKGSLGELKDPSGQALLNESKVNAVLSLSELLGRLATQRVAKERIKDLLDQGEGVDAAGDALASYATLVYLPFVKDARRDIGILTRDFLDAREAREELAARQAKLALYADDKRLEALEKAVPAFQASVTKMKAARMELRAKLDKYDDMELFKQLYAFSEEVRALHKQLRDAF